MSPIICWLRRAIQILTRSALWRNRFYIFGLMAQKGLPILILPLIVTTFGRNVYGDYVLLFTVVQVYATLSSLAVPQTIVPMWFRQAEPLRFVGICLVIIAALALLLGVLVAAIGLTKWGTWAVSSLAMPMVLVWIVVFSLSYNLNALAVGLVRAQDRQRHFFWGAAAGSAVLAGGVSIVAVIGPSTLQALVLIQVLAIIVATIFLFGKQPLAALTVDLPVLKQQWKPLLQFSLPLTAYSMLVLFSMSLDKWMARLWFPRDIFNTYVIDYQCAFAMVFVPTAINLYNGPRISAFVAAEDWDSLALEERRAAQLTIVGCSGVAILMYSYAWMSDLALSKGYWLLATGFMFEGLYILRTNRLMAQLRSFRMLFISATGIAVYIMLLAIAAATESSFLLYTAVPAYLGLTLALAYLYTKKSHLPSKKIVLGNSNLVEKKNKN